LEHHLHGKFLIPLLLLWYLSIVKFLVEWWKKLMVP
jgi:hypothetical protein